VAEGCQFTKLLVALDGKAEHEPGLPLAAELGRICGASLLLLTVVPTLETLSGDQAGPGLLLPATMSALLDLAEQEAREYLAKQIKDNPDMGVTLSAIVVRGAPVDSILAEAAAQGADLVVLATHGRRGTGAFWSGSVAPKVILRSKTPLLLVRAPVEADQSA
jgi:nucleotide-binding universal stress UspA family protein